MFRQYEDPFELQEMLNEVKREYFDAIERHEDDERIIDLCLEMHELEDRINFAWQDIEYDEMYSEL